MPQLEFSPSVIDFGYLVCEHQLAHQSLTITNTGSKTGTFSFLADQVPHGITVSPTQMKLEPGQVADIKVGANSLLSALVLPFTEGYPLGGNTMQ